MDSGIPYKLITDAGELVFNDYRSSSYLHLTSVTGMDFAQLRTSQSDKPGRSGTKRGGTFKGGLVPLLEGRIVSNVNNRDVLASKLRLHAHALVGSMGRLQFLPRGVGDWWEIEVGLQERLDIQGDMIKTFQLPLLAEDPTFYSSVWQYGVTDFLSQNMGGGLRFPFKPPLKFSPASGNGSGVMNVGGDIPTPPILRIYGPAANPIVINSRTGERISLTKGLAIQVGHFVEIDTAEERVVFDGIQSQSLTRYFEPTKSVFWRLQPNQNLIRLIAQGADYFNTHLEAYWRNAHA